MPAVPLSVEWRACVRASKLDAPVKLVAYTLSTYWNGDGTCSPWGRVTAPGAGPSLDTLTADASLSERAVRAALRKLEKDGWLTRTHTGHGRGNTHRWVAAIPAGVDARETRSAPKVEGRYAHLDD